MPWPIRSGRSTSSTSPISSRPMSPPSSPTWIVTPRPASRASSTIGCDLPVVVARAARARAGDVDADDPARRPADRLLDDDLVLLGGEGAVHHQDQARAHLRVLEARAVEAADRGEDDVVEVALAAAVPLHRVEAQLERRDPLRAVGAADRAVHRALDRERARLDQLRPVVDRVERVEVGHAARVGDRDEPVEVPVVLDRQRDPLLVRERPEDVGGDRAAEVGVQLGETSIRTTLRVYSARSTGSASWLSTQSRRRASTASRDQRLVARASDELAAGEVVLRRTGSGGSLSAGDLRLRERDVIGACVRPSSVTPP